MELRNAIVRDADRVEIGRVRAIALEPDTLDAQWLEVLVRGSDATVLVPAAAVTEAGAGELVVPYRAQLVTQAQHEAGTPVTVEQARRLRHHYGFAE